MYTVHYQVNGVANSEDFKNPHEAKRKIDEWVQDGGRLLRIIDVTDADGNIVSINPTLDDVWCGVLLKEEVSE